MSLCALAMGLSLGGCADLTAADKAPRGNPIGRLVSRTPSPWTADLGDPILADVLRQSDAGSLDVKSALARLARADAEVEAAVAANRLRVDAGLVGAVGGARLNRGTSAASPTFEAAYEFDPWRRFARARAAAKSDRSAAAWDVDAARLAIGSETAQTYLDLRAAQASEGSFRRQARLASDLVRLTEASRASGVVTVQALEVKRIDLAVAEARAQTSADEVLTLTRKLAALAGQRGVTIPDGGLPAVPIAVLDPSSDQVDRRPDVQAAFARVSAADARRAAAVLASRPKFQFAAALGAPDAALSSLLDVRALAWAAAATLTKSLLDGPERRAQVHIATAEADLADIAYRQAVMTGWSELQAAAVARTQAERQLDLAGRASTASQVALAKGERQHAAGRISGYDIIDLKAKTEGTADALRAAQVELLRATLRSASAAGGR